MNTLVFLINIGFDLVLMVFWLGTFALAKRNAERIDKLEQELSDANRRIDSLLNRTNGKTSTMWDD